MKDNAPVAQIKIKTIVGDEYLEILALRGQFAVHHHLQVGVGIAGFNVTLIEAGLALNREPIPTLKAAIDLAQRMDTCGVDWHYFCEFGFQMTEDEKPLFQSAHRKWREKWGLPA